MPSELIQFLVGALREHAALGVNELGSKLPSIAGRWAESSGPMKVHLYPRSAHVADGALWFLVRCNHFRWLVVCGSAKAFDGLDGETTDLGGGRRIGIFRLTAPHAERMRKHFEWLNPMCFGYAPTFGCGDRLGFATPGHIHAARACKVNPILAQQSMREMSRTQRTPQQVMDDAMWGVFQEGWTAGFGADADHLKTLQDIETMVAAGFTMFTIDPSEYVDRTADSSYSHELDEKLASVGTTELPVDVSRMLAEYACRTFEVPGLGRLFASTIEVKCAIVKYGRAIAHTERMARHLQWVLGEKCCDLEMSVDETDFPTTLVEHLFIGMELRHRGVDVQSLALRFVGEFQKGIDYIGDVSEFEKSFLDHFAIAKFCGDYKMSIHSGSDKFAIFPIIGRIAGNRVHEKTAGTSYLEALRVVARADPKLFREIAAFALDRYPVDRMTYHVAEKLDQIPVLKDLVDAKLETLLDLDQGRQLLHVTFGSVLCEKKEGGSSRFKEEILRALRENEEMYAKLLEAHFSRHMDALGMSSSGKIGRKILR